MKISPCEDDIISVVAIWPVIIVAEVIFLATGERSTFLSWGLCCWISCWASVPFVTLYILLEQLNLAKKDALFPYGNFTRNISGMI